ncbi:MAG: SDR family oxidoreductase [Gammaproteobacteria bacterium]|nr:SDR family oxidoreductase [Gammaproteobacteria bacterium]NIR84996.1 SDR family oxidoreductase [Gammaproteobacteria bacterium]NIR88263.1 SDR family oxidoreductase [Gammaproteobacteria bacterium]NIU06043.1 SDR family oxidoreductase [Gammaproteobacteria bacterium]NIV73462.1 SDR family oxidoreductase [Gammaproteobacteria bacterium]
MDLGLKDKVALVTGASRGLGAATAAALASEGARLVLTARDEQRLRQTAKRVAEAGAAEVETVAADLTGADAGAEIAEAARERFGRIDILVNSAGASQGGVFWELPDRVWEESFALKFMGTVRMMRAVIPTMREQKYGRIVTIVGNNGRQPPPRMLPGAAANAALLALTAGLAQEVATDGVVVLAVNPGPTRTERWNTLMQNLAGQHGTSVEEEEGAFLRQIPMGRLGAPEEVGRIVAFLASDAAANMTGTSVTADGGWTKALA